MTLKERLLFDFLCRKYVQEQDARQKEMGLQYTTAETHDLVMEISGAGFLNSPVHSTDPMIRVAVALEKLVDTSETRNDQMVQAIGELIETLKTTR